MRRRVLLRGMPSCTGLYDSCCAIDPTEPMGDLMLADCWEGALLCLKFRDIESEERCDPWPEEMEVRPSPIEARGCDRMGIVVAMLDDLSLACNF